MRAAGFPKNPIYMVKTKVETACGPQLVSVLVGASSKLSEGGNTLAFRRLGRGGSLPGPITYFGTEITTKQSNICVSARWYFSSYRIEILLLEKDQNLVVERAQQCDTGRMPARKTCTEICTSVWVPMRCFSFWTERIRRG